MKLYAEDSKGVSYKFSTWMVSGKKGESQLRIF